jgi:hypothetical protein
MHGDADIRHALLLLLMLLQNGFDVAINITATPESGLVGDAFTYTINM